MTDTATPGALDPETVGRVIDEHYRARRDADPKGPPLHECGSYCGRDIATRLRAALATPTAEPAVPVETEARDE